MDIVRFLFARWLLRATRRLLRTYVEEHHPTLRDRAHVALAAVNVALDGVELEAHNHVERMMHPMRQEEREPGSDDQLTDAQRDVIESRLQADRDKVRVEEQRTAGQPVEDDGPSHHIGGV